MSKNEKELRMSFVWVFDEIGYRFFFCFFFVTNFVMCHVLSFYLQIDDRVEDSIFMIYIYIYIYIYICQCFPVVSIKNMSSESSRHYFSFFFKTTRYVLKKPCQIICIIKDHFFVLRGFSNIAKDFKNIVVWDMDCSSKGRSSISILTTIRWRDLIDSRNKKISSWHRQCFFSILLEFAWEFLNYWNFMIKLMWLQGLSRTSLTQKIMSPKDINVHE